VEEPATSTFGIENFGISVILFIHRKKETWSGQSFLSLCRAPQERRKGVAVQFHIFLTSRVFGVERSAVRLCFFTQLYTTDSKLGTSQGWYRFSDDGWIFCWCQESTLALSQAKLGEKISNPHY
jgi:CRISPR/Cas system CMR-associated protein Cmr3 (group 5 of RAMP superfamily)